MSLLDIQRGVEKCKYNVRKYTDGRGKLLCNISEYISDELQIHATARFQEKRRVRGVEKAKQIHT